ncbi:MAG: response regulator transcription factor [Bacteroidetes bacterium]|nr:response regulator transcription factor [Bacteroidota bacterium]
MQEHLFKVLIVDDEPEARKLLRSLLSEINHIKVVGEAKNAENALFQLVDHYPNLILMDINMPGKSGMELVQLIRKRNIDVPVVFISAYEKYAIEAIRSEVYDFLLKPVERCKLKKIIEKYQRMNSRDLPAKLMEVLDSIKDESKIRINSKHSYVLLNPREIVYCTSENGYTTIYLTNGKTEISNTSLIQIKNKVEKHNFHRLGRSFLINLDYIRSVNKSTNKCILNNDGNSWEVFASHKSIKELLVNGFNYA